MSTFTHSQSNSEDFLPHPHFPSHAQGTVANKHTHSHVINPLKRLLIIVDK